MPGLLGLVGDQVWGAEVRSDAPSVRLACITALCGLLFSGCPEDLLACEQGPTRFELFCWRAPRPLGCTRVEEPEPAATLTARHRARLRETRQIERHGSSDAPSVELSPVRTSPSDGSGKRPSPT